MGYSTDFVGRFDLSKPLTPNQVLYLTRFSGSRRMQRDATKASTLGDPLRECVGLPIGDQGCYYVGIGEGESGRGVCGQARDESVTEYNTPPNGQPGLWCQWIPTDGGKCIEWDGGEKFRNYVEWLQYIVEHFIKPWGLVLSGEVTWCGEDYDDRGKIIVTDNEIKTLVGHIVYSEEQADS